jgi:hypothetical protein
MRNQNRHNMRDWKRTNFAKRVDKQMKVDNKNYKNKKISGIYTYISIVMLNMNFYICPIKR